MALAQMILTMEMEHFLISHMKKMMKFPKLLIVSMMLSKFGATLINTIIIILGVCQNHTQVHLVNQDMAMEVTEDMEDTEVMVTEIKKIKIKTEKMIKLVKQWEAMGVMAATAAMDTVATEGDIPLTTVVEFQIILMIEVNRKTKIGGTTLPKIMERMV